MELFAGIEEKKETLMRAELSIANELVKRIVEAVHPLRIILFGSAARGDNGPRSDIDVLVVMPKGTHRRKTWRIIYKGLYDLGCPKDVVVATAEDIEKHRGNPSFVYDVAIREGKELYHAE